MSPDNLLRLTRESVIDEMARLLDISATPSQYRNATSALLAEEDHLLRLSWDFGTDVPDLEYRKTVSGPSMGQDISNAISVHKYVGPMAPVAASDKRLWTYLTHTEFAKYQDQRWPLEGEKWKSRVAARWLMRNASRGALVRNGISRLWWAAELTFDPHKSHKLSSEADDEYAYLRVLLAYEDAFMAITDRDTGMIPNLLFAILEHIDSSVENGKEAYIRALMKEIVLIAGYSEFAGLGVSDIDEVLVELSKQLHAK